MNGEQYVPWDTRARYHFFPTCTVHKKVIIFSQKFFGNAVLHGSIHRKRFSAVKPLAEKWYQGTLLASLGATHVPGQMQVRATRLLSGPMFGRHQKQTWRLWREWMFVRCPGAFKSVRTPTDDATALSSRRRTCQATNLQIFWSHFEALTQKVPLKKGNYGISITNLSSFSCSCCSYLHRLWDKIHLSCVSGPWGLAAGMLCSILLVPH